MTEQSTRFEAARFEAAGDQQARFQLDGLSCASCVARAERALTAVPGVQGARVNLADQSAEVRFAAPATAEAMGEALARAGYAATPEQAASPDRRAEEVAGLQRDTWVAGLLTLPVFVLEWAGICCRPSITGWRRPSGSRRRGWCSSC